MTRKEFVDKIKGRVVHIKTYEEYQKFLNLVDDVNMEFSGNYFNREDVWKRYKSTIGFILNKDGRTYKLSYIGYRLAITTRGLKEMSVDEMNE